MSLSANGLETAIYKLASEVGRNVSINLVNRPKPLQESTRMRGCVALHAFWICCPKNLPILRPITPGYGNELQYLSKRCLLSDEHACLILSFPGLPVLRHADRFRYEQRLTFLLLVGTQLSFHAHRTESANLPEPSTCEPTTQLEQASS